MGRIERLHDEALSFDHHGDRDRFLYLFFSKYRFGSDETEYERYAEAYVYALENMHPVIGDDELIVGRYDKTMSPAERAEWDASVSQAVKVRSSQAGGGQESHMAVDYDLLLQKGISGLIRDVQTLSEKAAEDKKQFYTCCVACLGAVCTYAAHYAAAARALASLTSDAVRKAELLQIADACENVPLNPPRSFFEAVQSVHFLTFCLSLDPLKPYPLQFQLGHPDRYLYPYYQKDMAAGVLTKEQAQEILDCLGVQINMRVPDGLSSGYMIGGRDDVGNTVANELTDLCLQVVEDVHLVYPAVGLCYTTDTPDTVMNKACDFLTKGYSHPALFNDDVIARGLQYYGVDEKQSHNYIHSTCVEITPVAASNVWVASPYTNMPQLLLDIMNREYDSFDALLTAYYAYLDERIRTNFEKENNNRIARNAHSVSPLLSCFVNDCLSRGRDIEKGGARYNWIMPSFVGIANLVDALYAIRKIVFEQKRLTLCAYKEILDANYAGHEDLQAEILHGMAKYGNDNDEIDAFFGQVTAHIADVCEQYRSLFDGRLIPSAFCWVMHEKFGRDTGATPDGRTCGFPLGDGSGPCQGREQNGPTASILSSTKWDHTKFIGGVAVNLKFAKSSLGPGAIETIKALVKTYFARGGFELQVNCTDNAVLRAAQQNPEAYRDLLVRIGGYSDYYVRLSPQMQAELILRTSHEI